MLNVSQPIAREQFGLPRGSNREIVCVQGLGLVGAAMAAAVAAARDDRGQRRFDVIGVELDSPTGRERAQAINAGIFPFQTSDASLGEVVAAAHRDGNLVATTDVRAFRLARIAIVDVNLDLIESANGAPVAHFEGLEAAIRTLGRELPFGALVLVETTVPPGTCANVIAPLLAEELRRRRLPPETILLAHSYERVMPGPDYFNSIVNFWRAYAGHTLEAARRCEEFLSKVVDVEHYPLRRLSSTTASETAKVLENSYRAVNIALIEEWARFAEAAGIDLYEVITAIRDRPSHNNIRQPGFGVGGYCLPKDPLFPAVAAEFFFKDRTLDFPFCRLAVDTNRKMPIENLDRIEAFLGSLKGKTILVLGVAYRSDVDDVRSAPAEQFCREAINRGATVICHDPYVRRWGELANLMADVLPDPFKLDAVVFAVPHKTFRQFDVVEWLSGGKPFVYDCDNVLTDETRARLRQNGVRVESTGRGVGL